MLIATFPDDFETPRLLLDIDRLQRNADMMRKRCRDLGVQLRPHLKTSKSIEVARAVDARSITVSTLKEAGYFARAGYRDILYTASLVPAKIAHVARIARETGTSVKCVTDNLDTVAQLAEKAARQDATIDLLIEIDCGEHRSGLPSDDPELVRLAAAISGASGLRFQGLMTHAGHSYNFATPAEIRRIAVEERDAVLRASGRLSREGIPCPIVSVGSSPTVLFADHLDGVTEVRCGIYLFWDLSQYARRCCALDQIAVSVLASVIGHNAHDRSLILDAGALALSKDIGANRFLPDAGYGYVCDVETLRRHGDLSVTVVHQEHGTVPVTDDAWFTRLPVGSLVRIIPNHACLTCAAYDHYDLIEGGAYAGGWPRINGW